MAVRHRTQEFQQHMQLVLNHRNEILYGLHEHELTNTKQWFPGETHGWGTYESYLCSYGPGCEVSFSHNFLQGPVGSKIPTAYLILKCSHLHMLYFSLLHLSYHHTGYSVGIFTPKP